MLGRDPFGAHLDATFVDRNVRGRTVSVRRLRADSGAGSCRIAFLFLPNAGELRRALSRVPGSGVLTVCERKGCGRAAGDAE